MQLQKDQPGTTHKAKPDGGYVQISTLTLGLLWWAYSEGLLTLRAVRVGLALFELRIRRFAFLWTEKKRGHRVSEFSPKFSTKEIADLCGLPEKRARAALQELLDLGVVTAFSETNILFARSPKEVHLTPDQHAQFEAWWSKLTRRKRIPVPRRILVLACESSAPALIAVILGACLRCSWLHPGEGFTYSGRLSCTWLARHFRLSLRAIRQAKEHLTALKWIERKGNINRFGETVAINPAWHRLTALPKPKRDQPQVRNEPPKEQGGELPLFPAVSHEVPEGVAGTNPAGSPPPDGTNPAGLSLTESLPSGELKDQRESQAERPEPGPGIYISRSEEIQTKNAPVQPLPPPRLSAIRPEDFADVGRALVLFALAVKCGLMPNDSEHSRLLWMAAIERARTTAARNPAGLFLFLIKNRRWNFLSDGHFEAANRRLKAYLYPERGDSAPVGAPTRALPGHAPPRLSRDALLLQTVRNELARRGLGNDVFLALRAHAGWDRARYDAAVAELDGADTARRREMAATI